MIFLHGLDNVVNGTKTQTRRIIRYRFEDTDKPFRQHKVGTTLAIQPHRSAVSIGRIRILRTWEEDVRQISQSDLEAEGFGSLREFFRVWIMMHDARFRRQFEEDDAGWYNKLLKRPDYYYAAVAYEFRVEVLYGKK